MGYINKLQFIFHQNDKKQYLLYNNAENLDLSQLIWKQLYTEFLTLARLIFLP